MGRDHLPDPLTARRPPRSVRIHLVPALLCGLLSCAEARDAPPAASGFSVPASAIEALQLTVTRQDSAGTAETEQTYFMRRATDPAAAPLEPGVTLVALIAGARPTLGLQRCDTQVDGAAQVPLYLAVELRIWIKGQRAIRLRSDSRCAFMLPWHVTDGARLSVLEQSSAGLALMRLIQAWCRSCLPEWRQAPPGATPAAEYSDVDHHYAALLAEWRRLGRHGATDIKIATLPLTDALDWMDHERFERLLRATAQAKDGEHAALAADLIRTLRVARWGYVDPSGNFLLPRRFEKATPFAAGKALVRIDGGWQPIDRTGRGVGPAAGHPLAPPAAPIAAGVTPPPATCGGRQRASLMRPYADGLAAARCGSLWGYVDRSGRFVIPPRYLEAGDFSDGMAPVR
jgi:hypothetical protein